MKTKQGGQGVEATPIPKDTAGMGQYQEKINKIITSFLNAKTVSGPAEGGSNENTPANN